MMQSLAYFVYEQCSDGLRKIGQVDALSGPEAIEKSKRMTQFPIVEPVFGIEFNRWRYCDNREKQMPHWKALLLSRRNNKLALFEGAVGGMTARKRKDCE